MSNLLARLLFWPLYLLAKCGMLGAKHHLFDRDGSLYMGRWNIIGQFDVDHNGRDIMGTHTLASKALMWLTKGRYSSVRLHRIMRSDHDRHLHNHPFRYRSLILRGWYCEVWPEYVDWEEPVEYSCYFYRGEWNRGSPVSFHRIASVSPGGVWTLFFMGPNSNEWGFMVDGEFVKSTTYFRRTARGQLNKE